MCVNFDLYASDNIWAGRNGAPYGGKPTRMVCQLSPQAGERVRFR
jgi:hypothetical protein